METQYTQSLYYHSTPGFADLDLTETRKEDAGRRRAGTAVRRNEERIDRIVKIHVDQIAYLRVHSRAVASYRGRSVL